MTVHHPPPNVPRPAHRRPCIDDVDDVDDVPLTREELDAVIECCTRHLVVDGDPDRDVARRILRQLRSLAAAASSVELSPEQIGAIADEWLTHWAVQGGRRR